MKVLKEDLRVIKTKRNIKSVMIELLKKKPVEKITVTELSAQAMINKGTFYLHYSDIYALYHEIIMDYFENSLGSLSYYDEFFTQPREFVTNFLQDFRASNIKKEFPFFSEGTHSPFIPHLITEILLNRLMETNRIEDMIKNRIRVQCCISAFTSTIFHFDEKDMDTIIDVLTEMVEKMM